MQVPNFNRTLVRSLMAGVVLLGANACSRADRAESGSDNTAATMQDTAVSRATQDAPGTGQDRMATDTTIPTSQSTGTGRGCGRHCPGKSSVERPPRSDCFAIRRAARHIRFSGVGGSWLPQHAEGHVGPA